MDTEIVAARRIVLDHIAAVVAHFVDSNTAARLIDSWVVGVWTDTPVDMAANSGLDRLADAPVAAMADSRDRVADMLAVVVPDSSY